jgi:hypothetical protein
MVVCPDERTRMLVGLTLARAGEAGLLRVAMTEPMSVRDVADRLRWLHYGPIAFGLELDTERVLVVEGGSFRILTPSGSLVATGGPVLSTLVVELDPPACAAMN